MSHEQNARTLEKMLALAQFGADGHKERRQVEFRVFISYITVLVISLYQVNKPKDPIFQNSDNVWIPLLLFFIHVLYCLWQKNISIALINDVRRRDFYLQKAQCLSYHLSQHSNVVFQPSWTKTVSLNKGGGRSSKPITEVDLFKERHPNIIQKASLSEFRKILYDQHIWFQIGVPTLLLIGLIATISKRIVWCLLPILLLFVMVVAILDLILCEYQSLIYRCEPADNEDSDEAVRCRYCGEDLNA